MLRRQVDVGGRDAVLPVCRCKPKLKLRIINQNSVSVLQTPADAELDHGRGQSRSPLRSLRCGVSHLNV